MNASLQSCEFNPITDETCAICLEQFDIDKGDISEIGCGHRFHRECLSQIVGHPNAKWNCPLCRADFQVSELILV